MPTENRSSNTEQMVSARVCAYTPGQSKVELQLIPLGLIPSWLELGQPVTVAQHQGEPVADARDYAIEHAGFLADAADQVLADYKAYSVAQMLKSEGGDDGDGELEDAVDAARDDLHEGLANLRGMAYEFRKRRVRSDSSANVEPAPTSDDFSAGDMADQGAKAFREGVKSSADFIQKRMDDYLNEFGAIDPETGSVELPRGGDEYVGELQEIIEAVRALPMPQ